MRLSKRLDRLAGGWAILALLLIVVLISQFVIQPFSERLSQFSGGNGLIDLMLAYTPETVYRLINSYGDEGRAAYRHFTATGDLIFPVAYGLFLSLLLSWLLARGTPEGSRLRLMNLLPVAAWGFDWLENILILLMLANSPQRSDLVAWLAAVSTASKWLMSAFTIAALVVALVLAMKRKGGTPHR